MDLFKTQKSFIKYKKDAVGGSIEGFDLLHFLNDFEMIVVKAAYSDRDDVQKINENYVLRTIEYINRKVGYPGFIDIFMEDIDRYNFTSIDRGKSKNIIKEASKVIVNVL